MLPHTEVQFKSFNKYFTNKQTNKHWWQRTLHVQHVVTTVQCNNNKMQQCCDLNIALYIKIILWNIDTWMMADSSNSMTSYISYLCGYYKAVDWYTTATPTGAATHWWQRTLHVHLVVTTVLKEMALVKSCSVQSNCHAFLMTMRW